MARTAKRIQYYIGRTQVRITGLSKKLAEAKKDLGNMQTDLKAAKVIEAKDAKAKAEKAKAKAAKAKAKAKPKSKGKAKAKKK